MAKQIGLFCDLQPTTIEARLAAPNGGYVRASTMDRGHTK